MPHVSLNIPHALDPDEAVQRLKTKLAAALAEHQSHISHFHDEWRNHACAFSFQAVGLKVRGDVAVERAHVQLNVELPFAAMFFKRTIEDRLRQEVTELVR